MFRVIHPNYVDYGLLIVLIHLFTSAVYIVFSIYVIAQIRLYVGTYVTHLIPSHVLMWLEIPGHVGE